MECMWNEIHKLHSNSEISKENFFSGINVWIERPHIVNRKLSCADTLHAWTFPQKELIVDTLDSIFENGNFSYEETVAFFENIKCDEVFENELENCSDESSITVTLRKLIPRNLEKFKDVLEVSVLDRDHGCVTFYPRKKDVQNSKIAVSFAYRIKLLNNSLVLESYKVGYQTTPTDCLSEEWLKTCVLPKIINWSQNSTATKAITSLKLISPKSYNQKYFYLKSKYGKHFIQIWPECTDPLKYVYEDIAIAAYLMTIWDEERKALHLDKKQSFIDIGCGNGLLVHILSSEGHVGVGVDVRKRKIWDLYGSTTTLIEKAIEPSNDLRFPEYDWIIGNHSDELTPWIPVIAARSSYSVRVFLLPCCFYTFNGKYQRSSPGITQYQSYLNFISELCNTMGFNVAQDKLRIPSTKRVCFVCYSRKYKENEEKEIDVLRETFIQSKSRKVIENPLCSEESSSNDNALNMHKKITSENISILHKFKPRDPVESVRNCSQLDKVFLDNTVINVMNILLKTDNYIFVESSKNITTWNRGGLMTIEDIVKLMDPVTLKSMKKQCGGFQTFLRNYKSVFQVQNGNVQLRIPSLDEDWIHKYEKRNRDNSKIKSLHKRKCHFYYHHPQGCPLATDVCTFSHELQ